MSMADEAYRACQNAARAQAQATGKPVATDAVLTRHALESFLHRLTLTEHADSFVLKGGVLLAAYDYRRTTREVDSNAVADAVTVAEEAPLDGAFPALQEQILGFIGAVRA